jgi:hypothetical protein
MNKAIAIIVVVLVFLFAGWRVYTKYQETHPKPATMMAPGGRPGAPGGPGGPMVPGQPPVAPGGAPVAPGGAPVAPVAPAK